MKKLKFKYGTPKSGERVDFYFLGDTWDDYGYKTIYFIYATEQITGGYTQKIGSIQIMSCDSNRVNRTLLYNVLGYSIWNELPMDMVSSSLNVKLYSFLCEHLTIEQRQDFVNSLHLILQEGEWLNMAKDTNCFQKSLRRSSSLSSYMEKIARFNEILFPLEICTPIVELEEGNIYNAVITSIREEWLEIMIDQNLIGIVPMNEIFPKDKYAPEDSIRVMYVGGEDPLVFSRSKVEMLEGWENLKKAQSEGSVIRGKIKYTSEDFFGVSVMHNKAILPFTEATRKQVADAEQQINRLVDIVVLDVNDAEHLCVVSCKAANLAKRKTEYEAVKEGDTGEIMVKEEVEGKGYNCTYGKLRAFMPFSQVGFDHRVTPILGNTLKVKVLSVDAERQSLVVSHRAFVDEVRKKEQSEFWEHIEKGTVYECKINNVTDYGVFVDIGAGISGLVPAKEVSWGKYKEIKSTLGKGQIVHAAIVDFDEKTTKISLSIRLCTPDPWESIKGEFSVGKVITGTIRSLCDFGAFIEVAPGVLGLLHVSHLSWDEYLCPFLLGELKVNHEIKVKIAEMSVVDRRISLSQKLLTKNPWLNRKVLYGKSDVVKGEPLYSNEYGTYVKLDDDFGGFVRVPEYDWGELNPSKAPKIGVSIPVKVVRAMSGKIDLSIKRLKENPLKAYAAQLANRPVDVVVKELDTRTQEVLVEYDGHLGYIKRIDLAVHNVLNIEDAVSVGKKLHVLCIGCGDRYLKFSKKALDSAVYEDALYSMSQAELLNEMEIQSNRFIAKVEKNKNCKFVNIAVAYNEDRSNEDKGRLLTDTKTGRNIQIRVPAELSANLEDGEYCKVDIELADEQLRRKCHNPFIFGVTNIVGHISNPYKETVIRSFSKHNSPSSNTSIAHLLSEVGENLYSSKKRMFYELLQNADDSAACNGVQFSVETEGDYLIITHDGKSFNLNDFQSIISAAKSTKSAKRNSTGYKGIGFKSVFTNTSKVLIKTGGFFFSFDSQSDKFNDFKDFYFNVAGKKTLDEQKEFLFTYDKEYREFKGARDIPWQLLPIWEDKIPNELADSTFADGSNVAIAIRKNAVDIHQVETSVRDILSNPIFMLFLRNVKRVQFVSEEGFATVSKEQVDGKIQIISSLDDDNQKELYERSDVASIAVSDESFQDCGIPMKKSLDDLIPGHDERAEILVQFNPENPDEKGTRIELPDRIASSTETAITFAVKVVDGHVVPLKEQNNCLYAYLPLEEKKHIFRMYINADFIPTSDREGIQSNNPWNWFLFYNIGRQLVGEVASHASIKNPNYLNLLQDSLFDDADDSLAMHFNQGYKEALIATAFILGEDEIVHTQEESVIDKTGLSRIIGAETFYKISGTQKFLPSFKIDDSILRKNCEVEEDADEQPLFEKLEVVHLSDIKEKLSNNEDLLSWFKSASDKKRTIFYKWIVENELSGLAETLPIFTFGEEQLTRSQVSDLNDYIISTINTIGITDILEKLDIKCSAESLDDHPLADVISPQDEESIYKLIETKIADNSLDFKEKHRLMEGVIKLKNVGEKSMKAMKLLLNKKGEPMPCNSLTHTSKSYLAKFAILDSEYDDSISKYLVSDENIASTFFIEDNIDDIFSKENISAIFKDYHEKWDESFWKSLVSKLDTETMLLIIENASFGVKKAFLEKVPKLNLEDRIYTEDDVEYRYYMVAQNAQQSSILLNKTYIEENLVCQYTISDDVSIVVDQVPYKLQLSEILPNRKTYIAKRFQKAMPFVTVDLKELDKTQINDEIVEELKTKEITPSQFVYICLWNKSNNRDSYYPLKVDQIQIINDKIKDCIDFCYTHKINNNLYQFRNVNGVHFGLDDRFFANPKLLLSKETISPEIEKWADTEEKKTFLYKLGVKKSDSPILKNRTALLDGTDYTDSLSTSEETFDWITTISDKFKDTEPLSQKRVDLLVRMLESTRRDYKRCNGTLCQKESAEWTSSDAYQDWKLSRDIRIFVCPNGVPRELYHGAHIYCTIHTDDFYVEGRTIYVTGNVPIADVMNNVVNANSIFTRDDWYKLFTVASSDYVDLQEKYDNLQEEVEDWKRRYHELLDSKSSVGFGAGDDSDIEKQKQIEAQKQAQRKLKEMMSHVWKFPEHFGETKEDGELYCFSTIHVTDMMGDKRIPAVVKSYIDKSKPFKINPSEWDWFAQEHAKIWIYTDNDIKEVDFDDIIANQTRIQLTFSTDNLTQYEKIQQFSDILHYFHDIKFDFESFNITEKAQSIREIYVKHDGGQAFTGDNDL